MTGHRNSTSLSENEGVTDEALELTWQLGYVVPCFVDVGVSE